MTKDPSLPVAITGLCFFVLLYILVSRHLDKQYREECTTFHTAAIKGKIAHLDFGKESVKLKVDNNDTVYTFYPRVFGDVDFKMVAAPGDSVIKPAFYDTVTLLTASKKQYRLHVNNPE